MELVIISPKGVVCKATVESVSLPGAAGRFTVLRGHAPLVSVLEAGEIRYLQNGTEHTVAVKGGFVRVCKDKIEITVETDGNIQ